MSPANDSLLRNLSTSLTTSVAEALCGPVDTGPAPWALPVRGRLCIQIAHRKIPSCLHEAPSGWWSGVNCLGVLFPTPIPSAQCTIWNGRFLHMPPYGNPTFEKGELGTAGPVLQPTQLSPATGQATSAPQARPLACLLALPTSPDLRLSSPVGVPPEPSTGQPWQIMHARSLMVRW